jgi:hypothetical protein
MHAGSSCGENRNGGLLVAFGPNFDKSRRNGKGTNAADLSLDEM